MTTPKVLVTGASGFIGKHCIAELLRRDFPVRGTLRDPGRAEDVRRVIARTGVDASSVDFVAADLLHDDGWDDAMEGCSHVLHVASPFPLKEEGDPNDVIRPAREGTLRVLNAATRAGVKRVVQTSSIVALTLPWPEVPVEHVFTEEDWTNPERPNITSYVISKTLAERAAWDFVKGRADAPELAVVNPGFVLGPALDPDLYDPVLLLRFDHGLLAVRQGIEQCLESRRDRGCLLENGRRSGPGILRHHKPPLDPGVFLSPGDPEINALV